MKRRDSVNKKLLYVGAICFLVSLFTACEALGPEPEPVTVSYEKAVVRVQIGNGVPGRTVMPDIAPPGIDKWELWGGKLGDDTELLLTFNVVADAAVALEPGEWHFTIEGYKGDDYMLSGSIAEQTISLEGTQTLSFEVEPVVGGGSGTVSITIKLPAGSGITSMRVRKGVADPTTIAVSGNEIVFEEPSLAGEYYYSFRLFNEDGKLIGVVSEMVHVWANLRSEKTYTLLQKDLNLTYTISYLVYNKTTQAWGDLIYNETTQAWEKFMPDGHYQIAATTTLATPSPIPDYYFKGWYERPEDAAEDALSGSAVTQIPLGSTGDKAFYAKWIPKTLSGYSLEDALAMISASPEDGDDYTIVLDKNETWTTTQDLTVTGGKEITITIDGGGKTIKLGSNGSLFTLGADTDSSLTLILEDITLQGKSGNNAPVVQVNSGANLDLQDGSSLTGNSSSSFGGGVSVASGGTLSMSGGTISSNTVSGSSGKGGGVYIDGGTFEMSGGTISNNKTPSSTGGSTSGGGGVFITNGGTFTMTGGAISNNSAYYDCGGVFVHSGTFEMSGSAIISGNSARYGGGVLVGGGTFTMSDGVVSGNSGSTYGGGVYAHGGTFTMTGGVIYGSEEEAGKKNTAGTGAAIYKNGGTSTFGSTNSTIDMRQVTP
ncbi:MAG: hypothetical protein LBK00_00085 [Treponema sp.]|jgi:hypothetical protein|nr:hypothetical protein [Treponema sp.]